MKRQNCRAERTGGTGRTERGLVKARVILTFRLNFKIILSCKTGKKEKKKKLDQADNAFEALSP